MQQLLGLGDPPPFSVHNAQGKAPLLLLCDHASKAIPKALGDLGLPAEDLLEALGRIGDRRQLPEHAPGQAACAVKESLPLDPGH